MNWKQYIFLLFVLTASPLRAEEIPSRAPILSARLEEVNDLILFSAYEERLKPFMPQIEQLKQDILNVQGSPQHTPPELEDRLIHLYDHIFPILEKKMKSLDGNFDTQLSGILKKEGISYFTRVSLASQNFVVIAHRYWGFRPISSINQIVVHHTDTESVAKIYNLHVHSSYLDKTGAPFIAYHYLILKKGEVIKLNYLSERVWQAKEANQKAIGIALLGNHEEEDLTKEQKKAFQILSEAIKINFGIKKILGHREVDTKSSKTICPGKFTIQYIGEL